MTGSPRLIAAAVGGLVLLFQLPARVRSLRLRPSRGWRRSRPDRSAASCRTRRALQSRERWFRRWGPRRPLLSLTETAGSKSARWRPGRICSGPTSPATWAHADRSSKSGRAHARRRPSPCATRVLWPRSPSVDQPARARGGPGRRRGIPGACYRRAGACSRLPAAQADSRAEDDHSETAWRLRHLRRGILKDITVPPALLADEMRRRRPRSERSSADRPRRPPASTPTSSPAYRLPANSIC